MIADSKTSFSAGADMVEIRFDQLWCKKVETSTEDEEGNFEKVVEITALDFDAVNVEESIEQLKEKIAGQVVFTCRSKDDGGKFSGTEKERSSVLKAAITSNVSYVDIEIKIDKKLRKSLMNSAKKSGTKVVASHHDLEGTPSSTEIVTFIEKNQGTGDIVKACYTATCNDDGLQVVDASWELSETELNYSLMATGSSGDWCRLHAPLLNQNMVYTTLDSDYHLSSRGLVNVGDLRESWMILEY
jgi:3-dehydroquinate dehydratase type I